MQPVLSFFLPAVQSLCVMVWNDSLHAQCQGHHQGLMNERLKEVKVEQEKKRKLFSPFFFFFLLIAVTG